MFRRSNPGEVRGIRSTRFPVAPGPGRRRALFSPPGRLPVWSRGGTFQTAGAGRESRHSLPGPDDRATPFYQCKDSPLLEAGKNPGSRWGVSVCSCGYCTSIPASRQVATTVKPVESAVPDDPPVWTALSKVTAVGGTVVSSPFSSASGPVRLHPMVSNSDDAIIKPKKMFCIVYMDFPPNCISLLPSDCMVKHSGFTVLLKRIGGDAITRRGDFWIK